MRRRTKTMVQAVVASVGLSASLIVGASPAQAAVYNCGTTLGNNTAGAYCNSGFGSYRVKATCSSPNYPYVTTIYGPWITRKSTTTNPPSYSWVNGDNYNCHITSAVVAV
ncbi:MULTISPECIES: hypothetical protein [unclassified Streptomyces]|uniref:hypothetical protein n=1 Tax=unclassified Streptomyces TaxID=2593676 RepID=UPI0033A3C5E4